MNFQSPHERGQVAALVEKCKRLMLEYGSRCSARMGDAAIGAVAGELRAAIEELAASTQAPEAKALDVVAQLDEEACTLLHGLMRDDGELSPITLHVGDGHSGRGLYASLTEYPDEGSVFLCAADAAASPEAPAPPKYTEEWCMRMAALESQSDSEVDVGAPAPQGVQADLTDEQVGQLQYRGNTVSYMYDRAKVYGDEITRCWDVLRQAGKNAMLPLHDAIRAALAAPPSSPAVQPQPETLWDVTNLPSKYIALYMVLNSEQLRAWRSEAAAKGIDYTDVVVEIDGVAASFTLDEFARRLGIGAPAPAVQPESTRYGSKQ